MAVTTTPSDLEVTKFREDFFKEYVRENLFAPYTGEKSNNVIVIRQGSQIINIPLVVSLSGAGVRGTATLDGNEETLKQYSFTLEPQYRRNGVRLNKEEKKKPAIDQMRAARECLMDWGMEEVKDDVIKAMASLNGVDVTTSTDTAINTAGDSWLTNNSDRVLYGAVDANLSAGDHSASLANIDGTADKLTGDIVRKARLKARMAGPKIRPIRVAGGIETYVMFVGGRSFVHLKQDLETLHADSGERGMKNPLYKPGDLYWDNVVIREIPEISTLVSDGAYYSDAGASSSKVEPAFFCGAQALGYGLGQKPDIVTDPHKDYGFQPGVAVELMHQIKKATFNNKDHGMVSVFVTGE